MSQQPNKVAIAHLYLPDGRVVLQRRTSDAPVNAGLLGHFGGHVKQGETFDEAAKRELAEETSLPVARLNFQPLEPFTVLREGKPVEYHPFAIPIDFADFEVYEGVRAEPHEIGLALSRDDLTSSVRHLLELIKENE